MKICILVQNLYTLGGVQRVVTTILNSLSRDKSYDITVIMPFSMSENRLFELDENIRIKNQEDFEYGNFKLILRLLKKINKVTRCFDNRIFNFFTKKIYFNNRLLNAYEDYFNANKFDVVIGVACENSILLGIMSDKFDFKSIGWQHSTCDSYFSGTYKGLKSLAEEYYKKLDRILVLTLADKNRFDQMLKIQSTVYPNPVSLNRNNNIINKEVRKKSILFAGRLVIEHKGLDFLAEILKKINFEKNNWRCTIVGDGPDRIWLENQLEDLIASDYVEFIGNTDNMPYYYQKADVLLQTSRFEGFGMTITEAMSFGVPTVAFENLGPNEIIRDGKDGYLIPKYDTDYFVEKVEKILMNFELKQQMKNNCFDRVNDFSLDTLLPKFKDILEE